jgi:hypothetical protein
MSIQVPQCPKCNRERQCDQVGALPDGDENLFGVIWKCPGCEDRTLVVSPTGPLILEPGMCLNCGQQGRGDDLPCLACSFSLSEVLPAAERGQSDEVLLESARAAFALGTCRRGLTLVNFVLRRNPQSGEAWSIKGQFLDYLGFRVALKIVMQEAVRVRKQPT